MLQSRNSGIQALLARGRSASAVSYLDQAIVSGSNFVSGVVLARTLSQDEFGLFVLSNLALLLALGFLNALLLQPLVINGASLDEHAFRRFLRANVLLQTPFIMGSSSLVALVALLWEPMHPYALHLALAAALWQGQEFCRRVLYTRARVGAAIANNLVNYSLQALLLATIAGLAVTRLDLGRALVIVAATSGLAVLLGVWQLRDFFVGTTDPIWAVARRNLNIGKWVAATVALSYASVHAFPALVAAVAGLASTAGLGVVKQIIGPIHILLHPLENYFLARVTHALEHEGQAGLNRALWEAARTAAPFYLLYLAGVAFIPALLLELAYGARYVQYADALRLFALAQIAYLPIAILMLELNARRLQRYILAAQVWNVAIVYGLGAPLISRMDLSGAALALGAAAVGELAFLALQVARIRRRDVHASPAAHGGIAPADKQSSLV